ncbi:hypothetical protein thsrh120_23740 [Rhizobium sp. No.120]
MIGAGSFGSSSLEVSSLNTTWGKRRRSAAAQSESLIRKTYIIEERLAARKTTSGSDVTTKRTRETGIPATFYSNLISGPNGFGPEGRLVTTAGATHGSVGA